jgi:hypothetical protein
VRKRSNATSRTLRYTFLTPATSRLRRIATK